MRLTFRHISGSKTGLEETFERATIRIGRDPSNDLTFDPYLDRDASGFHAEVFEEEGTVWLRDVGSTNGTYMNGEKVQRSSLQPGVVIGFGRNGPKLELLEEGTAAGAGPGAPAADGAAVPAAAAPANPAGAGEKPRPGHATIEAMVRNAVAQEREKRRERGGTAVVVREAVDQALSKSKRRNRLLLGVVSFVLLLTVAGGALAFVSQWRRIREQEDRIRQSSETADEARRKAQETEETVLKFREESQGQFFSSKQEEAERNRELEEGRRRIERLEEQIQGLGEGDQDLDALRKELAKARNERAVLQRIEKDNEPSIFLLFTRFTAKGADGKERKFQGFGTGFIATPEGHLITNKHVVQPWKFSKIKALLDRDGLEFQEDSLLVAAWRSGSRVYVRENGALTMNLNAGYNTQPLGNLEILTTAPDHMDWLTLGGGDDDGEESPGSRIYAHVHDNNDLAVLKIRDRFAEFRAVALATEEDIGKLEKLDPVLSLGFPRGGALLERGLAEPSASRGDIRKIEDSILISAPIIGGNSGGPVFNETGHVIGVSTRTIRGAESFGFCIPVTHAVQLLPPEYR